MNTVISLKNIGITLAILISVGFALYLSLRTGQRPKDTIVVGMMSGWAPFMSINNKGEYEGFDVDVAEELAKRMGKKIIIEDLGSLPSCALALDQGRIDMIFSGLDITQKRREQWEMIYYTGDETKTFGLLFWDKIPQGVRTIEDLKKLPNVVIATEAGSSQEKFLEQYTFCEKKPLGSVTDILLDLQYGRSTAGIVEPRLAQRFVRQYPELRMIEIPLSQEYVVYGCGIALKKNNSFVSQAKQKISEMINDGTIKKLELQWQLGE